jgi:hypothetical protein
MMYERFKRLYVAKIHSGDETTTDVQYQLERKRQRHKAQLKKPRAPEYSPVTQISTHGSSLSCHHDRLLHHLK